MELECSNDTYLKFFAGSLTPIMELAEKEVHGLYWLKSCMHGFYWPGVL